MGIEMLAVSLAASLLTFCAIALVIHAFFSFLTYASSIKRYAAKQMLVSLSTIFSSALTAGIKVVASTLTWLMRLWIPILAVVLIFSCVNVTYNEYPSVWTGSARFYNRYLGPLVHILVTVPLYMVDILLRALLPLWDSAVWFGKALLVQGLLPVVLDEVETVLQMATTLFHFIIHLVAGLFGFVDSFFCDGAACLHPEKGVLDILSCLGDVREFAALSLKLVKNFCGTFAAPLDLMVYPLMDLNLAEGLHNLVNAVVQLVMVIPKATVARCSIREDNQFGLLMCTPDFAPFFNFFAAGFSSLGLAVDNWLNIAFVIVQQFLTGSSPTCSIASDSSFPERLGDGLFLTSTATTVVGLTDWMYAVTDGVQAYYMAHNDGTKTKTQTWPYSVDPGMGIAAVTYSDVHDLDVSAFSSGKTAGSMQTTAMLGCNCSDDPTTGMQIMCAILPMSGIPTSDTMENYRMQVLFPTTDTAMLYRCAGVDLYVKSVRWSFTRYETADASLGSSSDKTTLPTHDCIARGTCRELDATVWLVPRCGQDVNLNAETACMDVAPCFPFCMAARSAGSGRNNLVLNGARRWREGMTILSQDCALDSATPGTVQAGVPTRPTVSTVSGTTSGLLQTAGVVVYGFAYTQPGQGPICKHASGVTSMISKDEQARARVLGNVALTGQPFAITGDTLLSSVRLGGDAYAVQVERLEGSEVDVFSLNGINQHLPALPVAVVPLEDAEVQRYDKLNIPYNYGTTRIASVNSRNYVFYASNPNADALGAYFQYCHDMQDPDKLSKFGILLKSSYSRIRVYRVKAYRRCAAYSCGPDLVDFVGFDGFSGRFSRACDEVFNASVLALEYLNEDNIAVTVQAAYVRDYDSGVGFLATGNTTTRTYWLNPATMRLSQNVWETAIPSSSTAVLCPSMQRLPRVGSFVAEVLNSGVFLLKFVVSSVLYTPGMMTMWRVGRTCPIPGSSMYHSVLANCGERVYSLDDFFDSVDDAGAIFWHSLSLIGTLLSPSDPTIAEPFTRVLDGMSQYGQGTIDLWAAKASVLTLTRVPIKDQITQIWATVQSGLSPGGTGAVQGLAAGGAGLIAWSRYSYRAGSVIALEILKRVLDPTMDLDFSKVSSIIFAKLYDLREEFDATVATRMRLGCAGVRLMFGVGNPWSELVYHQCAAAAELTRNLMDLTLNIFVQIPMAKCVCKDSAGQNVADYVKASCAPSLPLTLLPTLYMIANEVQGGATRYSNLACVNVLARVKTSIGSTMDPWFDHQFKGLDALASSVEYATSTFDAKAGKCLDFQNDPHIVVIVPQPVDYFQRCSGTSRCRQICSTEWGAFQTAVLDKKSTVKALPSISVTMESMFFPGELDASLMLTNVSASVELPSSLKRCLVRSATTPADFSLALAEVSGSTVTVQFWCAPQNAGSPVYRVTDEGYGPLSVPGSIMNMQFGDETGEWVAVISQTDGVQSVFVLSRTGGVVATPSLDAHLDADYTLMRVENMWVIEGTILVDLVTRYMATTSDANTGHKTARSTAKAFHVILKPGTDLLWRSSTTDLMQFGGGQYWYTKLAPLPNEALLHEYMFLPKVPGMQPYKAMFMVTSTSLTLVNSPVTMQSAGLTSIAGMLISSRSQSRYHVFATSRVGWDWLKQVRLTEEGVSGVFGSTNIGVTVDIQGNCNAKSCEGCSDVQVQRMCLAYNKCALINCVGTPVHQRRPLCGIGALLRHNGGMGLMSSQAAWTIFSEMLAMSLQMSLLSMRDAQLLWPEDAFLCYVCQAKDRSAEFFSILTATVNSALQMSNANVAFMYGGASNVDTNADAVLTISSTALNAFLHQVALFPIYGLVVSHQIVMCEVTGVIALLGGSGFVLSLKSAGESSASDIMAGQCLTVGAETMANYPTDRPSSLGFSLTSMSANMMQTLFLMQIEPILHMLDGALAYLIGVVQTFGVVIMSQNSAKCNPPDFHLKDVVTCACGDQRLQIPLARSLEKIPDSALWCTGVLGMIDSSNQPYYVYNRFSYSELQSMSSGLQTYTQCVTQTSSSQGYKCPVPNHPEFQAQGVTTLNVLVKCRENFVKKRWDPLAYMLYQDSYWHLLRLKGGAVPQKPASDPYGAGACLAKGDPASGTLARDCMDLFLLRKNKDFDEYWMYERTDTIKTGPEYTDACLVFSGPAAKNITIFANCVDGVGTNCTIPQHLWTPLSDNNVPAAEHHRVASHGTNRDGLVQHLYQRAQDMVSEAVEASIKSWSAGGTERVDISFFSIEGDVLHQTMDCMFMGPYSRVDYWPTPMCLEGEECLRGPFWSRDEEEGLQRSVDPKTCSAPDSLPFTCGSPARKSLMRFLVRNTLDNSGGGGKNQNATLVKEILLATLQEIRNDWLNDSNFGCACVSGYSPACCSDAQVSLLPPPLNKTFTMLNSTTVLKVLQTGMANLYDQAMENRHMWLEHLSGVAPEEQALYNWSTKQRVEDDARFHPVNPLRSYTSEEEAMSPLLQEDSTLWDVCHAALKQVFFTLPVDGSKVRDPDLDASGTYNGDPARLQEFVKRFTSEAFRHSPLFRHYSPRHAPSQSQMCNSSREVRSEELEQGPVSYNNMVQAGVTVVNARDLSDTIPAFHPQSFRLGETFTCLCGWQRVGSRCFPPTRGGTRDKVCRVVACSSGASVSYDIQTQAVLQAAYDPSWFCPEFELSAHWGFMDSVATEAWLGKNQTAGLVTSSRELFQHGRAGVRAGNLQSLPLLAKTYLNPSTREIPLERGRLTTCTPPPPPEDLMTPFIDNLFPAAQAVDEAGVAAYCVRYSIELARLEVLKLLALPRLDDALAMQREQAEVWRRRCGTQLHLMHMCTTLGVFRPPVQPRTSLAATCSHFKSVEESYPRVIYTTAQCLISVDNVFYDPCRCMACTGQRYTVLDLAAMLGKGEACRLRFDPRSAVQQGHPIGWADGLPPLTDDVAMHLLHTEGYNRLVLDDPDAVGNVGGGGNPSSWWDAEGPMEGNSEFCDGVLDWWDETWDFPVGYHVTVPCEGEDTAYKSFEQAFALDAENMTLVYQHDLLRDSSMVDSHFGVGGLCHSNTFGMPMPETNNMRYCTKIQIDDTEDFTLPVQSGADPTDGVLWGDEQCSGSSQDLPWPDMTSNPALYQSTRYSVGTIPNMPSIQSSTYPATDSVDDNFKVGPWQEIGPIGQEWGTQPTQRCQDYSLRYCLPDTDCPMAGYACKGRVCSQDKSKSCTAHVNCSGDGRCQGVCVDASIVQCLMHSECPDDKMCSGLGNCVKPVLAVRNLLEAVGDNVSLSMSTAHSTCGSTSTSFSMLEASYWGNTAQDLLRVHGMCSFEDWFKYTESYSKSGCSELRTSDDTLVADPTKCRVMDLELSTTNITRWWPAGNSRPDLMYLRPAGCDRDYERLQGFLQCAPGAGGGVMLLPDGTQTEILLYDQYVRLHENKTFLILAHMQETDSPSVGFLGLNGSVPHISNLADGMEPGPFIPCASVGQCYPADFTVNNAIENRSFLDLDLDVWTSYPPQTPFICGAFGIEDPGRQGCRIDLEVMPLYRFLCVTPTIASCTTLNVMDIRALCNSIPYTYHATNQDRTRVLTGLRDLFYIIPSFDSLDSYFTLTTCVTELYAQMQIRSQLAVASNIKLSDGLYFPFMFTLYEFPFDWYYQCMIMAGTTVDVTTRSQQDCSAFITRDKHRIDEYTPVSTTSGDTFDTYLQYVQGGYTVQQVNTYSGLYLSRTLTELQSAKESSRSVMFPHDGSSDLSYPRCSMNLLWRIGPNGDPLPGDGFVESIRAIAWNWNDPQTCQSNWHSRLVQAASAFGVTADNWESMLTYADPFNLIQQAGSGAVTILDQVTNFMALSMQTNVLPNVMGGSGGALLFNTIPPSEYDFESAPVPTSLIPEYSVDGGTIMMDDTVNRTCVFLPDFDPSFANAGAGNPQCGVVDDQVVSPTRVDRLRKCGQRTCTNIPVAYKRNGRFSCRYIAESVIPATCTEASRGCELDIVAKIYDDVYKKYLTIKAAPPPVLRPLEFAWFARTWAFNGFNLLSVLDYERNIQPNPERTVMCEITTNAASAIKFTTCNNPHFERLRKHVDKYYKHDGAVQIPAGAQLEWSIGRSMLNKGVILSYSNTNKPLRQRYMDALFDSKTVCKGEVNTQVCRKDGPTSFKSINPWLMGKFNPYEVCDVDFTDPGEGGREYIYSNCLKVGNTACESFNRKEIPTKCNANHNTLVNRQGVPRYTAGVYTDYNLCHHRVEEDADGCMHDQGLLGGYDGLPIGSTLDTATSMLKGSKWENEPYTVSTNLYLNSTWSIPDDYRQGFFSLANPLWRGDDAPYGHLQIPDTGIGGHRIGISISRENITADTISTMKVAKIALGLNEDKRFIDDGMNLLAGVPVNKWVPGLFAALQTEDRDVSSMYSVVYNISDLSASCPLKRWMFYSADNAAFSPTIPSALRAKHLFHRVHGGLAAHPTMKRVAKGAFLGRYTTSNGFCACPVLKDVSQPQCRIPISTGLNHACSLSSTLKSIKGDVWLYSHVFPPLDSDRAGKTCSMLLDWPTVDGVLRDGSLVSNLWTKASSTTHKECHVLDRLVPFKYKYTASNTLVSSGKNTVKHGVCKTGRVVTLDRSKIPKSAQARCLRFAMDYNGARFTCNTSTVSDGTPWMARRIRLTVPQMLAKRSIRRTKCNACSPPPKFKSEAGADIPPESSFGRLHRWSTERMLAKDLMDALCENTTDCKELLNSTAWKRGVFMRNYMTAPHLLFKNTTRRVGTTPVPTAPEPASRWVGKPWVYCPTPESLRTGEGCQGTMSRSVWMQSKTTMCPLMVKSFSASTTNTSQGDPMVRTPFCSVDNTTNKVCLAVAEARQLVIKANCIARGDLSCMPQPFVYHPASYEPSNNAWIHDSVQSFYTHIDKSACDAATTAETQSLIDFARIYQRGCPANAVNLMVGILQIVRVVATEVALITSSMVSLIIKVLGLFFTGAGSDMRPYIAADWQYIKTKAHTLMETQGDMLVDAMLNSGELGARLMGFLERTCYRINSAIEWFLNVWCNYIQQYMIQVLSGLRHAMGIMGAGFDMVQDFVDEIFQGVLPAAFVAKYATTTFQTLLTESYSQPTEHKDKVKSQNNVPDTVNPRPNSRLATARNRISRVFNFGKSPMGKALGYAGTAGAVYGMIQGAIDLAEELQMRKLWPENFTLFDLTDVVNTLDDMERFLLLDESCYEFQLYKDRNQSYNVFPCPNLNLSGYGATTAGTTSLVATQCWADARPSLGQNSLFACSSASTCCKTTQCKEYIMCSSCPEPFLGGVNRYGCDSLRKMCVCGQAVLSHDRCSANRQCDIRSQCDLVSSLNSVSYGTIPCANCPGTASVMCLLPTTGFPGRCACMLDSVRGFDLCSDLSGMRTSVDGTRLCAYLQGATPSTWVFDLEDLIMVPCNQVKVGVCSTVMQAGVAIQMVVAETVTATFSGRRRILSDDSVAHEPGPPTYDAYESEYELTDSQALHDLLMAPGWNTTAAPCSTLAMAYQEGVKLGILETHVLHKCGFWRYVGKRVIAMYNMTTAMADHETFLLSMDDLIYALMSPAVVTALLHNPQALGSALLYHPWIKPIRAFGVAVANQVEHMQWLRDIEADVHDPLFGFGDEPLPLHENQDKDHKPKIKPRFQEAARKNNTPTMKEGKGRRALLSVQDSIQAVAAYSAQIIGNPDSAGQVPVSVASAWSTTTFSWPPRYSYSLESCPIAQSILQLAWQAVMVNKMYFDPANFNKQRPPIDRSLRATLPKWTWINNITILPESNKTRSLPSQLFHAMLDLLRISPSHLVAFFLSEKPWSIQWILQTALQCDLASVVTCSRHENDLLMSHVVFFLLFLLLAVLGGSCGMGGLAVVFFVSYPWFILWYTFGMAPSCFPMLPPCLLGDIVSVVSELVPPAIVFPATLQCDANQTCLRPCTDLNFTSWADPLAFAVCDTDPATCAYFKDMGPSGVVFWDTLIGDPMRNALTWAHQVVIKGDLAGHRMCTWVTFIDTVPILIFIGSVTLLISALLAVVYTLVPPMVVFLCQAYVYSETE